MCNYLKVRGHFIFSLFFSVLLPHQAHVNNLEDKTAHVAGSVQPLHHISESFWDSFVEICSQQRRKNSHCISHSSLLHIPHVGVHPHRETADDAGMLGKRQRSMIGKLSELLVSGSRLSLLEGGTSPRGPLDLKTHSPRGLKGYDLGGVGLGIVVAMEKSSGSGPQARTRYCICNPTRVSRPGKVPAEPDRTMALDVFDDSENYTYVTCYSGPNCQPCTRVYTADGREYCCSDQLGEPTPSQLGLAVFPTSEFLSSCHSCGKKLQGEDIYMYK